MKRIICSLFFCLLILLSFCNNPTNNGDQLEGLLWHYDLNAPSFRSAAVEDIDNDGYPEIVFGTYFNDEYVYALNAENGTLLWRYHTGGKNDAPPVIADVDQDGALEVILGASTQAVVYCFNGSNGAVKWSTPTGGGNEIELSPAIADVDGDNRQEIILGTLKGHVFCLNGEDGSICWHINLGTNSHITGASILDLDGDGNLDLVVAQAGGTNKIYALKGKDGSILWISDLPQAGMMMNSASFADLDDDGKPEIVIGSGNRHIYALNGEDGSLKWDYLTPGQAGAPTSIADLNNDGHYEVVFTSTYNVGVLSRNGKLLWSHTPGGYMTSGAVISDTDNDGNLDVIFITSNGIVCILRGDNGQEIRTYDLRSHFDRGVNAIDYAPIIADFDNDGRLDIFVVIGNISPSHGRAYALRAGAGNSPVWKMFRHDLRHSAGIIK